MEHARRLTPVPAAPSCLEQLQSAVLGCIETTKESGASLKSLSPEEIEERMEAASSPASFLLGDSGITARYSCVCQRGWYPDAPDKPNQDAFKMVPTFGGSSSQLLLAVFDGHGSSGDKIAQFVRDDLEQTLAKLMLRYPKDFNQAYKVAYMQMNQRLHHDKSIDDRQSGTTACSVFFGTSTHPHGARLTVI